MQAGLQSTKAGFLVSRPNRNEKVKINNIIFYHFEETIYHENILPLKMTYQSLFKQSNCRSKLDCLLGVSAF